MYIDPLSLTWYLVGAESKILKQSKLQEIRHDSDSEFFRVSYGEIP